MSLAATQVLEPAIKAGLAEVLDTPGDTVHITEISSTGDRRLQPGTNVHFEVRIPFAQDSSAIQAVASAVAALSRESVKALTVTFSGSRYRNKVNFGLAVQIWLLTSVLLTLYSV